MKSLFSVVGRLTEGLDRYFANTQALCNSFKTEMMLGYHCFKTTGGIRSADEIKAALYLATATINKDTTAYTATGEVSGTNYTATGQVVTNDGSNGPELSGDTAIWTPTANLVWADVTLATAFDCVLLYNSTQANRAISVHTFGSQTITAGTFTLTMPTHDASNALIRIA